MKYIKQYENPENPYSVRDEWENATDDEKTEMALQALAKIKSMKTDFKVGDYVKFREEHKKKNDQVLNDLYIITKINGGDRPKKYRDKIQDGYMTNARTGDNNYYSFQHFEKCTEEEIAANKYNL